MRIRSESNWMCIGCALIVFTWHNRDADLKWILVSMGVINNSKWLQNVMKDWYQPTRTMLEGCSEACPTHEALLAVGIRHGKVAQWTHWNFLFYSAVPLFTAIRKKSFFFPNVAARAQQNRDINVPQATTSQANEQAKNLMVGVTLCRSWRISISSFNLLPIHLLRWIGLNAHVEHLL